MGGTIRRLAIYGHNMEECIALADHHGYNSSTTREIGNETIFLAAKQYNGHKKDDGKYEEDHIGC